ncbi:hypothetical protein D3C86_1831230 [compost metagenome]
MHDTLSLNLLLSIVKTIIVLAVCVNGLSVIAMRIGFINKSVPTTIVMSFLLCSVVGNAVIGSFGNNAILLCLLAVVAAIGAGVILNLMNKVNRMEID